jgi:hypothetical protein
MDAFTLALAASRHCATISTFNFACCNVVCSSDVAPKDASLMAVGKIVRDRPVPFLYGVMIVTLLALLPLPPLLQNQEYHQFADQRELFGIPNF